MEISELVTAQRKFFERGETVSVPFRRQALASLRTAIMRRKGELLEALRTDLGKSPCEGFMSELGLVLSEISYMQKQLPRFAKPKRMGASISQFPAKCFTLAVPYGVTLIMSPWNYPIQLNLCPLVDSIAAGNCAVVKTSEYAPASADAVEQLIRSVFPPEYACVVKGGREENTLLLKQKYDMIFFTGGKTLGKLVAAAAAETLTPAILELGGKSPCIVDADADVRIAARRVAFGKFLNAGQTCVAPDYVLAASSVKNLFLSALEGEIIRMYGENPLENPSYPHIATQRHFDRIRSLILPKKTVFGGKWDERTRKIQPTVLDGASLSDPAMQEEIFGPVLPVIAFDDFDEAKEIISHHPTPLALYYFGKANERRALREIQFGGGCINDTVMHLATHRMGFGGVGESGIGSYHGERGFYAFSHVKSILKKGKAEISLRYPPYTDTKLKTIERLMR